MNVVKNTVFAYLKLAALVNKAALNNVTLLQRLSRVHAVLLGACKTRQDTIGVGLTGVLQHGSVRSRTILRCK